MARGYHGRSKKTGRRQLRIEEPERLGCEGKKPQRVVVPNDDDDSQVI